MISLERPSPPRRSLVVLPILAIVAMACSGTPATQAPTVAQTDPSTQAPTDAPTDAPSDAPTLAATDAPTDAATAVPPTEGTTEPPDGGITMTIEEEIATSGKIDDDSFCGTEPMTLGIHDGLGANAWSAASYAAVRTEAAKCPNVTQDAKSGEFSVEKAISDLNAFVSQGYEAIVVIPDAGDELQALKDATAAGVVVVPWGSNPGGEPGTDYLTYVDWDTTDAGVKWAEWMVEALGGEGNVVFLGGFAGSAVGHEQLNGINSVFENEPGITLLTGTEEFVPTNWDPAMAQEAMTALLNQHDDIDGVITNYGTDAVGVIRAFEAAGRPLVPMTSLEANALGCGWEELKAANPDYELTTISSRNWLGRIAARKAISAVQGIPNNEPDIIPLALFEDTLHDLPPQCDPEQGPDVYLSNDLTAEELAEFGTVTE
jgi:ribose transport system substrate-binding protein